MSVTHIIRGWAEGREAPINIQFVYIERCWYLGYTYLLCSM